MNKNYYDILEINRNASPEIIEKAYKTLAKKYHPDLQDETNKKTSEEILKQINEAYDTLSNPDRKKLYDENLNKSEFSQEDAKKLYEENINLQNELRKIKNSQNFNINNLNSNNFSKEINVPYNQGTHSLEDKLAYEQELQNARQQAYHDAYIQDLKNRGYKIRYKKTFKDYLKNLFALVITMFILFLIFQIPFIKNFFMDLYNDNILIHSIVDFFEEG